MKRWLDKHRLDSLDNTFLLHNSLPTRTWFCKTDFDIDAKLFDENRWAPAAHIRDGLNASFHRHLACNALAFGESFIPACFAIWLDNVDCLAAHIFQSTRNGVETAYAFFVHVNETVTRYYTSLVVNCKTTGLIDWVPIPNVVIDRVAFIILVVIGVIIAIVAVITTAIVRVIVVIVAGAKVGVVMSTFMVVVSVVVVIATVAESPGCDYIHDGCAFKR